jgi:CubicO group peptidase (beta-lactamase class C family)
MEYEAVLRPDHVASWLSERCAALGVPAASATICTPDAVYSARFGELGPDGAADTLFPLGCVAKLVTAVLVLRLRDRRKLELDTPLLNVLSRDELRAAISENTRVGHLLSHTSGVLSGIESSAARASGISRADVLGTLRQDCEPGTIFSYAHTPYVLAGLVAEGLAGIPWEEQAHTLLVGTLGGRFSTSTSTRILSGHSWRGPGRRAEPWSNSPSPVWSTTCNAAIGGAAFTSAETLALLGGALLGWRTRPALLEHHSLEALRAADWHPAHGGSPFRGVGMKTFARGCHGHGASLGGFNTLLLVCPDRQLSLGLATNVDSAVLGVQLMKALTLQDYDLALPEVPPGAALRAYGEYVGTYVGSDQIIEIGLRAGHLTFVAANREADAERATLSPVLLSGLGQDAFIGPCPFAGLPGNKSGVRIDFIADEKGAGFAWIRVNEVAFRRVR